MMVDIVQIPDQFGAIVADYASIIAGYYKRLVEEGVPEPLVEKLTEQFSTILWMKNLFPNLYSGNIE